MKRLAMVGLGAALVVLALGTTFRAAAQGEERPHPWMAGHGFEGEHLLAMLDNDRAKAALGLTDEQATRLRQIMVETEKTTIKTKADLAVRRIELRELLMADNPDQTAVIKKVQEVSALTGQLMQQHAQALLSAKTILTPEQRKKLREFRANQRWGRPGMGARRPGMVGEGSGRPPMQPPPANEQPVPPQEPPVQ
jgi:Spy/CpxP family protein refolding chaperone